MEEIESIKVLLQKRRNIYHEKYENDTKKQIEEHNNLMKQLTTLREESVECQETIGKNCINLITNENAVKKLLYDSKHVPGLPISHDCHQQSIEFFSSALDFLNNFQASDGPLEILQKDNVDTDKLNNDIVSCTNHISNEFYKAKSAFLHVEKVRNNIEVLCDFGSISDDENAELSASDS
ncbi:uncharacterized protein LOC124952977 [Vespa velutina]|uniref:uncharacterized protein LOC124952977 n=1 Tax=Vespa velutina TaxID=202808 RepID=UPI001FB2976B|nr:uncharacterized protein LOC124952977 [Vespa velutina]XP_047359667.1 uncharacterized protein LOC124952977 [Vespa velutina]XP_047359668.1 uncharacterized protein LOC124952977 [Vespa velutina]